MLIKLQNRPPEKREEKGQEDTEKREKEDTEQREKEDAEQSEEEVQRVADLYNRMTSAHRLRTQDNLRF